MVAVKNHNRRLVYIAEIVHQLAQRGAGVGDPLGQMEQIIGRLPGKAGVGVHGQLVLGIFVGVGAVVLHGDAVQKHRTVSLSRLLLIQGDEGVAHQVVGVIAALNAAVHIGPIVIRLGRGGIELGQVLAEEQVVKAQLGEKAGAVIDGVVEHMEHTSVIPRFSKQGHHRGQTGEYAGFPAVKVLPGQQAGVHAGEDLQLDVAGAITQAAGVEGAGHPLGLEFVEISHRVLVKGHTGQAGDIKK